MRNIGFCVKAELRQGGMWAHRWKIPASVWLVLTLMHLKFLKISGKINEEPPRRGAIFLVIIP